MNARDLSNLVTRRTLKVRKILIALNAETALEPLPPDIRVISKIEIITMDPSKIFILSLAYPIGLKAIYFESYFGDENIGEQVIKILKEIKL